METKIIKQNGGYPMHTLDDVKELYYQYIKNENDREKIVKAYNYVEFKHAGITRRSGEPYVQHLIEVAYILATLQAGPVTICAGLLHDVVEDTDATIEDIKVMFGADCAHIVDSLTKIQRLKLSKRTQEEFEAEDHRKIFLGMAKDVRVIFIKLADRLHNMRTIEALRIERQQALAKETLEVFAPIADRLGVYSIKMELEDLSLKVLYPEIYERISNLLNESIRNAQKSLEILKKKIADIIYEAKIPFEIESRVKSIYSIYRKMYVKGHSFNDIYDVLALRVITETEINCYEILGMIHAKYKPIPGRFKDYIAVPKTNMYQSLHTSIVSGDGNIFEIQIRTKEMDEVAEVGVAAHWRYKEGTNYNPKAEQREIEEKLHWFRDFINLSDETFDAPATEYMENLSKDIFETSVFVFTPKGRVIDLPNGSTPLDFAYKIHTKVGDNTVGAVVNGSMVPLTYVLKTGDVCEIKTSDNSAGPNEGWLKIVKTASARSHIKKILQKKNEENLKSDKINKGRQILTDVLKDYSCTEEEVFNLINTKNVLKNYNCSNLNDLFVMIANHNPTPVQILDFVKIKRKSKGFNISRKITNDDHCPVYVKGASDLKINLGTCCTPIPGDDIIGYVTKGNGITIHRTSCPNVVNLNTRLIDVYWKENLGNESYPVDIVLYCNDRPHLLSDIMDVLTANKIKVSEFNAKLHPEIFRVSIYAQIYVSHANDLKHIFQVLKNIKEVYNVERVIH